VLSVSAGTIEKQKRRGNRETRGRTSRHASSQYGPFSPYLLCQASPGYYGIRDAHVYPEVRARTTSLQPGTETDEQREGERTKNTRAAGRLFVC
jgi:hypothetical protein